MNCRRAIIVISVFPHNRVNRERIRHELDAVLSELCAFHLVARSVICDMNQLVALCHVERRVDGDSYSLRRLLLISILIVEGYLIRSYNFV